MGQPSPERTAPSPERTAPSPERTAPPPRRRRQRISADEVREKMLEAGRELIVSTGPSLSLEEFSLEDVIRHAGVSRSSVYRIWPYKDDYVDDLLYVMAGPYWAGTPASQQEATDLARQVAADHQDMLATAPGRRAVLLEAVRQGVALNIRHEIDSPRRRIHAALLATAGSMPQDKSRARIEQALGEYEEVFTARMAGFYEDFFGRELGLRLRDPAAGYRHLANALASLVEGLRLRQLLAETLDDEPGGGAPDGGEPGGGAPGGGAPDGAPVAFRDLVTVPLPGPGLDGQPAEWTLAAKAFMVIVDAFVEPDPDYRPGPSAPGPSAPGQDITPGPGH